MTARTGRGLAGRTTYIALFGAINVAGNKQLPMKNLMHVLENLDLHKVKTYIQSIAAAIAGSHGFTPQVLLLKSTELDKASRC